MDKQGISRTITCHKAWMTHLLYILLPGFLSRAGCFMKEQFQSAD